MVSANLASNLASRKNLLMAFKATGYDVMALSCPDSCVSRLENELKIPYIPLRMKNKGMNAFDDMITFFSYLSLYQKHRPDVVLHFNSKPNIYGSMASSMLGIPTICNITGLGSIYSGNGGLVRFLVSVLYRIAFSGKKTFVFFQNADDRELFLSLKILRIEKTGLLPGSGVDIQTFQPVDRSSLPSRKDPGYTRFLFVGRMLYSKGVVDFINAAGIVKQTYSHVSFCMVGEMDTATGFVPQETIDEAVRAGLVEYPGNVSDIGRYISLSDCVVLPSYYREGVPRSLLEAAAMATPLIACDCIGTREPVKDGKNGFLCKPDNPGNLAEAMIRFICLSNDEKNDMGKVSRDLAENDFSDTIVTARYMDVISKGRSS